MHRQSLRDLLGEGKGALINVLSHEVD
jgi:hypothetical protein